MKILKINYFFFCFSLIFICSVNAQNVNPSLTEDIRSTKHNLSVSGTATSKSKKEDQICVFCHTPHGSEGNGPIWNRTFSEADYITYRPQLSIIRSDPNIKGSLDSELADKPRGYSKLCLSCHDGTIGFGQIRNSPGSGWGAGITDVTDTTMPSGKGEFTGDTRKLGTNLTNDHPISFKFTQEVSDADKELRVPDSVISWMDVDRVRLYPLDFASTEKDAVQCTSCHNPHTSATKFLREPRYDEKASGESNQICYSCHPKPGWLNSTHELNFSASNGVALNYRKGTDVNDAVEADGLSLGEHGCLNCHDPHTMQGADRLHRNGASNTDGTGKPMIENTCFQCHISSADTIPIVGGKKFVDQAPDIKSHFDKRDRPGNNGATSGSAMPLNTNWNSGYQKGASDGIHQPAFVSNDTVNKESVLFNPEDALKFGANIGAQNIHVECVDCHNPHQVKSTNRVRGMKGIMIHGEEVGGDNINTQPPTFQQHTFQDDRSLGGQSRVPMLDDEIDKSGQGYDPLIYEICLRCHGDTYGRVMPFIARGSDSSANNVGLSGKNVAEEAKRHRGHAENFTYGDPGRKTPDGFYNIPIPLLAQFGAGNKRREFDPDSPSQTRHRMDTSKDNFGNKINYNMSYHPVAVPGRNGTQALFNQLKKAFDLKSRDELSSLTIMCTDCHNNDAFNGSAAVYVNGKKGPVTGLNNGTSFRRSTDRASGLDPVIESNPDFAQGPHGSKNKRILRDRYETKVFDNIPERPDIGTIKQKFALCFICHEADVILGETDTGDNTNFGNNKGETWGGNLHRYHLRLAGAACHECHNNVHSNVEADNTIFGDGNGNMLHPDGADSDPGDGIADGRQDTHLLNFGPQARGVSYYYPNWYYDSNSGKFRCDLQCHGANMAQCTYSHSSASTLNMWCAGWQ